jgi:hypothetical protein
LIDADALVRDHGFFIEDEDGFPTCVVCETDIRYYPTIDAVPVVRCENCKHFRRNLENDTYCGCVGGLTDPEENDFCSYGERRSDD